MRDSQPWRWTVLLGWLLASALPLAAEEFDAPPGLRRYALFGCDGITLAGNVAVTAEGLVAGPLPAGADLASNGPVLLRGPVTVQGDVHLGPAGTLIQEGSGGTWTGSPVPEAAALACQPVDLAALAADVAATNDNALLPSSAYDAGTGAFTLTSGAVAVPEGIYYLTSLTLTGTAQVTLGGRARILVAGPVTLGCTARLNAGGDARDLLLFVHGPAGVTLSGASAGAGILYAPAAGLTQAGTAAWRGPITGKTLAVAGARWRYALAAGGGVTLEAAATLDGTVKTTGDVTVQAAAQLAHRFGEGRVLSAGDVSNAAGLALACAQDVRARGDIAQPGLITGAGAVVANDTTVDTAPFIADGRLTPTLNPGEVGEVFPNPDPAVLLVPGQYVDHGSTSTITGAFDLGGQIHAFPEGVRFAPGSSLTGAGTIVVTEDTSAVFEIPLGSAGAPQALNVVAIEGAGAHLAGGEVTFREAVVLDGLIYAHDGIVAEQSLTVRGSVLAYQPSGADIVLQGPVDVQVAPLAVEVPGFAPWLAAEAARRGPTGVTRIVEPVIETTVQVSAATGATLTVPEGSRYPLHALTLPPGALAADAEVTLRTPAPPLPGFPQALEILSTRMKSATIRK